LSMILRSRSCRRHQRATGRGLGYGRVTHPFYAQNWHAHIHCVDQKTQEIEHQKFSCFRSDCDQCLRPLNVTACGVLSWKAAASLIHAWGWRKGKTSCWARDMLCSQDRASVAKIDKATSAITTCTDDPRFIAWYKFGSCTATHRSFV
jgi:hypothetical protein